METLKKIIASAIMCGLVMVSSTHCAMRDVEVADVVRRVQSARPKVSAALDAYAELVFSVGDARDQAKARELLPKIARARVLILGSEMALVETINRIGATPDEVGAAWDETKANIERLKAVAAELPVNDPKYAKRVGAFLIAVSLAESFFDVNYKSYTAGGPKLELDGHSVIDWYAGLQAKHSLDPLIPRVGKTGGWDDELREMECRLLSAYCRQTGGTLAECYAEYCRCYPDCARPDTF